MSICYKISFNIVPVYITLISFNINMGWLIKVKKLYTAMHQLAILASTSETCMHELALSFTLPCTS
jgi:hypothetical protein